MGEFRNIKPVKLIVGIFGNNLELFELAKLKLTRKFGKIDYESPFLLFNKTTYYQKEMGENLKRRFYTFERLIPPDLIAGIKIFTNRIEKKLARKGKRRVNIDPGYLSMAKFVLATTKDYSHRIYLKKGVFAEVTLNYRKDTFKPWEWTYPDYCQEEYLEIFNHIRKIYMGQLGLT